MEVIVWWFEAYLIFLSGLAVLAGLSMLMPASFWKPRKNISLKYLALFIVVTDTIVVCYSQYASK